MSKKERYCYNCNGINDEIKSTGIFNLCGECYAKDILITLTNAKKDYGLTCTELDVLPCKQYKTMYKNTCSLYLQTDVKKLAEEKHGDLGLYERKKHNDALQRTSNRIILRDKRRKAIKKKIESAGFLFDEHSSLVYDYITSGKPSMRAIVEDMQNDKRIAEEKVRRVKLLRDTLIKENISEQIYSSKKSAYLNDVDGDVCIEDVIEDIRDTIRKRKKKEEREQFLQDRLKKMGIDDFTGSSVRHEYLVDLSNLVTIEDVIEHITECHEVEYRNEIIREQQRRAKSESKKANKLIRRENKCPDCDQVKSQKCIESKCGGCCADARCSVMKHRTNQRSRGMRLGRRDDTKS